MKNLDLAKPDTKLATLTHDQLCAVKFEQSSKPSYERVLRLAKKSSLYFEKEIGDRRKKLVHLAVFSRSIADAKLAYALLEEMRVTSFKFTLFASGRIQKNKNALLNMLDCFSQSLAAKDYRAHCHVIAEDLLDCSRPGKATSLNFSLFDPPDDPPEKSEAWRLPCQMLDGFVTLNVHDEASPQDKLQAAANKRCVDLCPRFRPEDFKLIKQVSKGKRYW